MGSDVRQQKLGLGNTHTLCEQKSLVWAMLNVQAGSQASPQTGAMAGDPRPLHQMSPSLGDTVTPAVVAVFPWYKISYRNFH